MISDTATTPKTADNFAHEAQHIAANIAKLPELLWKE
jgi:hypothetical protein